MIEELAEKFGRLMQVSKEVRVDDKTLIIFKLNDAVPVQTMKAWSMHINEIVKKLNPKAIALILPMEFGEMAVIDEKEMERQGWIRK